MTQHRGKVLDVKAAATYSGLSKHQLRLAVKRREIAYVRLNPVKSERPGRTGRVLCEVGRLGFCEHDLDEYIEQRRVAAIRAPLPAKAQLPTRVESAPDANPLEKFLPPVEERRYA